MLGAIIGDIAGSTREFEQDKSFPTELFPFGSHITDDTILTLATAEAILRRDEGITYGDMYYEYASRYQGHQYGYGDRFLTWVKQSQPGNLAPAYNSLGNGSAMRIAPIGWYFQTLNEIRHEARLSALPTHNHPEGIKGAEAVASAIFLARTGKTKDEIREYLETKFGYRLSRYYEDVRDDAYFLETCPESVEEAIIAFLASESFEDAIYKAIALGGDADTQACIAGAIAEAFYKAPINLKNIQQYLGEEQRNIVSGFNLSVGDATLLSQSIQNK
jgi:ADP-ribosyl-[dinitrogen reductase] hydrolase